MRSLSTRHLASIAGLATVTLLAVASPAFAHVTVQPGAAQQGEYTAVSFRVPDESDTAATTKLEVSVPTDHPIASVATQPLPGWKATVETTKLATPVKTDDGDSITEVVSKITWVADATGSIRPGQFQEFRISLGALPTDTERVVFKTLQTYDDGSVVRWIDETKAGQPEPAHPAPTLTLTKADAAGAAAAVPKAADSAEAAAPASSDGTARTLGIVGIAIGAAGVLTGVLGRRRGAAPTK